MPPSSDSDSDSGPSLSTDLFTEPTNYYPPSAPATHTTYTLLTGQTLHLRLVGHNPLWGHHLWNGALIISSYLQTHPHLIQDLTILELGAGAGLPSLVAASLGARKVVVTDYPDFELIENLSQNILTNTTSHNNQESEKDNTNTSSIVAEGYLWGAPTHPLLAHLPNGTSRFDILILADLLFNHHCHDALVDTIVKTLARTMQARALVFFTPYRPWLLEKDMGFFDVCRGKGFVVEEVVRERMEEVMFKEDRGDEGLRRTVFGYEVTWEDLKGGCGMVV